MVWTIAVTLIILLTGCSAPEPAPTPTPEPVQVTNLADLVGIYILPGPTFGDKFIQIEEDGTLTFARGKLENLKDQATFVNKTWFESGIYHLKMTDAVLGDDVKCVELDTAGIYEGIYKIWRQANGSITFDTYADGCQRRVFVFIGAEISDKPFEWQPYP